MSPHHTPTTEQLAAIDAFTDLAENGTMRPDDRRDLSLILALVREQAVKLEAVAKLTQTAWEGQTCALPGGYPSRPVEAFDLRAALDATAVV